MNVFLWSGGYDSTAAIIKTSFKLHADEKADKDALLLSIDSNIMSSTNKMAGEAEARHKILPIMEASFPSINYKTCEMKIDMTKEGTGQAKICQNRLLQPQYWLVYASMVMEHGDTLYLGLIRDRGDFYHGDEIQTYWDGLCKLAFWKKCELRTCTGTSTSIEICILKTANQFRLL